MGIFSFLKSSASKTVELNKISKIIGDSKLPTTTEQLLSQSEERELAEERLYQLIENNTELRNIITKHRATREQLNEISSFLTCCGAGQWVKSYFVPIASLAFQATLDYALTNYDKMKKNTDDRYRVSLRLVQYFQRGEVRPINPEE